MYSLKGWPVTGTSYPQESGGSTAPGSVQNHDVVLRTWVNVWTLRSERAFPTLMILGYK